MIHEMKLRPNPFAAIREGRKTYELRLYDEKRQALRVGDTLRFTETESGETLSAKIVGLHRFPTFAALYDALPLEKCGYRKEELAAASPEDMRAYYTKEEEEKYGVVAIEIRILPQSHPKA